MTALEAQPEPHARKHLMSNPVALRKAQLVVAARNDAIRGLAALELIPLFAQIDKERRGGLSAGEGGEQVSKSRTGSGTRLYTVQNANGKDVHVSAFDARDKELDGYERDVERWLTEITARIGFIAGVSATIGRTHEPSKRERELAADIGTDCKNCSRPVACTPADRLRGGRCSACAQYWTNHGCEEERPKELWVT